MGVKNPVPGFFKGTDGKDGEELFPGSWRDRTRGNGLTGDLVLVTQGSSWHGGFRGFASLRWNKSCS